MVTANSLAQDLNVRMDSLNDSDFEEDRELVVLAQKAIGEVIGRIRPLIHYIGIRVVDVHVLTLTKIDDSTLVALHENGEFGFYGDKKFSPNGLAWMNVSFQALLDDLKKALEDAEAKRAQHLKAIEVRRQMLDEISKIALGASGSGSTASTR